MIEFLKFERVLNESFIQFWTSPYVLGTRTEWVSYSSLNESWMIDLFTFERVHTCSCHLRRFGGGSEEQKEAARRTVYRSPKTIHMTSQLWSKVMTSRRRTFWKMALKTCWWLSRSRSLLFSSRSSSSFCFSSRKTSHWMRSASSSASRNRSRRSRMLRPEQENFANKTSRRCWQTQLNRTNKLVPNDCSLHDVIVCKNEAVDERHDSCFVGSRCVGAQFVEEETEAVALFLQALKHIKWSESNLKLDINICLMASQTVMTLI